MDFSKVTEYMDSLSALDIPARDIVVEHEGKEVYRHFSGYRDYDNKIPMNGNEMYNLYSATKLYTTACAMRLIEDGKMALDDCIVKYLPEFETHPTLTVRHLMSMQGGYDYNLDIGSLKKDISTREVVNLLAKRELNFEPGTDFTYSLCHDILAAVVEEVSGMRFSDYMKKIIFEPLGMKTATFRVDKNAEDNMCAQYQMSYPDGFVPDPKHPEIASTCGKITPVGRFDNIYRFSDNYESGGAGLMCTASDYSRFVSAMAQGGCGILKPETIAIWSSDQLKGKSRRTFDMMGRFNYSYALGGRVRVEEGFGKSPIGEFGWDGAAGAYAMIDTKNKLSIFFAMHVLGCFHSYYLVHLVLRDRIYEALELC